MPPFNKGLSESDAGPRQVYRRFPALLSIILLIILSLPGWIKAAGDNPEPAVELQFFQYSGCPACQEMWARYWRYLWDRYQPHIRIITGDMEDPEDRARLEAIEDSLGIGYVDLPAVVVGDSVISGEVKILEGLEAVLRNALEERGITGLPAYRRRTWREMVSELIPPPTAEELTAPGLEAKVDKKASLAYFYREDCPACAAGHDKLARLERTIPGIEIRKYDLSEDKSRKLFLAVLGRQGIHPIYTSLPVYALADTVVFGPNVTADDLLGIIMAYPGPALPRPWRVAALSLTSEIDLVPLLTVVGAGLVDGINPCAMSTLVFLVAYLAYIGRRRREVLAFGIAFTAVVFITYLLVGLGIIGVAGWLGKLRWVMKIIYGATGAVALGLAYVNARDLVRMRRSGEPPSDTGLSPATKRRIHSIVRAGTRRGGVFIAGLIVAFLVTLFELGCTGQVYVPTLLVIAREGHSPVAWLYLVLYNLLFVLPLVAVFTATYLGVSASGLARVVRQRLTLVKILLTALFLVLGILLIGRIF